MRSLACSTLHQLLVHLHSILDSLSRGTQCDVIYFDICKAFDSVSHCKLLEHLWSAGICGQAWSFFKAYLYDRSQYVSINNSDSALLPVVSGVPQGSILGPLLFVLYIKDLPTSVLSSSFLLYAECQKSISCLHDCQLLQEDLLSMTDWSKKSQLTFNSKKTFLLSFRGPRSSHFSFPYSLDGCDIDTRDSIRDLGVIFSNNLTWSSHIQGILSKAYRTLYSIRRTFPASVTPTVVKKKLYLSLIIPIFTYCAPVWRPCLITVSTKGY